MHDADVADHQAGVVAGGARGDDEDRVVGREPRLQLLGCPGRRQVDVVLVERKHRNAARRQSARTGAADKAVGAEHDHPARLLWSGIKVLQHDDFPYPFPAISSSSQASTKSGSPRMASGFATSLLTKFRGLERACGGNNPPAQMVDVTPAGLAGSSPAGAPA